MEDSKTNLIDELEEIEEENTLNMQSFQNTSAYYADLSVDMIINYYEKNKFFFEPEFQRRNVWDVQKKSKFIESIILNIPIPSILLADDKSRNEYIIIDGKQRLSAIVDFIAPKNKGKGFKLKGLNILSFLNGYDYEKLMNDSSKIEYLSQLQTFPLKASIVRNYNEKLLYFIFERLNSGSVQLTTQELRHTLYPGEFSKFINSKSRESKAIKRILHLKEDEVESRMKDAELLCRYYAFKYFLYDYDKTVGSFLDHTYKVLNKDWEQWKEKVEDDLIEFEQSIELIYSIFNDDAFKIYFPERSEYGNSNRLVFDILSTTFSLKENREAIVGKQDFKLFFQNIFTENDEFYNAFKPVTSSREKTITRFVEFKKEFGKVYKNAIFEH